MYDWHYLDERSYERHGWSKPNHRTHEWQGHVQKNNRHTPRVKKSWEIAEDLNRPIQGGQKTKHEEVLEAEETGNEKAYTKYNW